MTDTCTIKRVTGIETDPLTGEATSATEDVYTGRCRFKPSMTRSSANTGQAGGHTFIVTAPEVHIPVGAADVKPGDLVECTAAVDDPYLQGRTARVVVPFHGSQATAMRLPLEVIEA